MRTLHMACVEAVEKASDYLDRELLIEERACVEEHLLICDGCMAYYEQIQGTVTRTQALAADPEPTAKGTPETTRAAVLSVFRRWRDGGGDP